MKEPDGNPFQFTKTYTVTTGIKTRSNPPRKTVPYEQPKVIFAKKERDVDLVTAKDPVTATTSFYVKVRPRHNDTVTPSRKTVPYEPRKAKFREKERDLDPVTLR